VTATHLDRGEELMGKWHAGLITLATCAGALPAGLAFAQVARSEVLPSGSDGPAEPAPNEILVTARRRDETRQTVPIGLTAVDDAALARAHVETIADLGAIDPSVTFSAANIGSSTANLIVRGIGTTGSNRTFEGSVGVFIDGVYRTRAAAALQTFVDIGEVQVLRGPQGTLFGKNTTGGAVLLSSERPSTDHPTGFVDASYGSYNALTSRAAENIPLSESAAIRVAGVITHTDGFFRDVTRGHRVNDDTTRAAKAQLLLDPAPSVSIHLIGDYTRSVGNCCYATSLITTGPLQPLIESLIVAGGGTVPSRKPSDREQSLNGNGHQTIEDYGTALTVDVGVAGGLLKSVTGYRYFRVAQTDMDPDFSGVDIFRYDEAFRSSFVSQELTYSATSVPLRANVVLGVFGSDEKLAMSRRLPWGTQAQPVWDAVFAGLGLPPGTADATPGLIGEEAMGGAARSYSAFAHGDMRLNDRFGIVAGLRYSIEEKEGRFAYRYYRSAANEPFRLLGIQPGPAYHDRHRDSALSGTLGINYRPSAAALLYLTYNRGFKAGGVNIDANGAGTRANNPAEVPGGVPLSPVYKPETIDAFEAGAKIEYLGARARTNLTLYYYDISGLQIAQFVGLRTTVINAQKAIDYGVEIENRFRITPGLTLVLDATWIPYARYGRDAQIDPVLAGGRFRFTPKVSANVSAELDQPVSSAVNLTGRVQYRYRGGQFVDTAGNTWQRPVNLIDASVGARLPPTGVRFEAFVQNLADVTYVNQALATPLQTGSVSGFMGAPRTVGVRVETRF